MVAESPQRVLLVADEMPSEGSGLGRLLAQSEWRFIITDMESAADKIAEENLAAAIVLAPPPYFNGHQKELIHVLDELVHRQIGTILLTTGEEDLEMARRMASTDGLMAARQDCPPEELRGRLTGLAAVRPIIDQLQRENAMLRKFDHGLNSQISQMDEEMRLAARLQLDFLPRTLPESGNCAFDVLFRPASYVSGDIYDVSRLDEHHVGFFVADAVGHGMPAALLTIFIKRTLQTKEILADGYRLIPPDEALAHLNNELLKQELSMCQFVTMVYGIINTQTLELQWARAGHPLPMLMRTDGSTEELDVDGALLGVFADEAFPLSKVQLKPGSSVLMYSDGFESAFTDAAGVINDRYRSEFAKLAGAGPRLRFQEMVNKLDLQEGSLHQRDDLTALLLTVTDSPV